MAGTVWIPEAENLAASGTSGTMLGGPPRVVWHTTEAPSGGGYFDAMHRVLTSKQAEPHILYDPLTDRMGQYFPLNRSSRALKNDATSGTSTNKTGAVCIQVEVVAYASKPFTSYWKPGPNSAALMRAIRSWGIPDTWPAGGLSRGGEGVSRSLTTWKTKAGHFGHCNVPGNSHWDPGAIDQRALLRPAPIQEDDLANISDSDAKMLLQRVEWLYNALTPAGGPLDKNVSIGFMTLQQAAADARAARVLAETAAKGVTLSDEQVDEIVTRTKQETADEVAQNLSEGYDLKATPKGDA